MIMTIKGSLTDLNTYIRAERSNMYMSSKIKKEDTATVYRAALECKIPKIKTSAYFAFRWYCKNKKKDKDNIAFAKKYIFDGLIMAKVLSNDGWKQIEGWSDDFYIDEQNPRIEVDIVSV